MVRSFRSLLPLLVSAVLVVACYQCKDPQCSNVPPIDPAPPDWPSSPTDVTQFPDDSPEALKSPCGLSCANFRKVECSDGKPRPDGTTCYQACLKMATLQKLPTKCWIDAKSVDAVRACGQVRCL